MNSRDSRSARAVAEIAGGDRELSGVLRRAQDYAALNRRLEPLLPESARSRIRVACVEGDCLVLATESPAWASRLRTLAPGLLEAADELWPAELTQWRVVVVPELPSANGVVPD